VYYYSRIHWSHILYITSLSRRCGVCCNSKERIVLWQLTSWKLPVTMVDDHWTLSVCYWCIHCVITHVYIVTNLPCAMTVQGGSWTHNWLARQRGGLWLIHWWPLGTACSLLLICALCPITPVYMQFHGITYPLVLVPFMSLLREFGAPQLLKFVNVKPGLPSDVT